MPGQAARSTRPGEEDVLRLSLCEKSLKKISKKYKKKLSGLFSWGLCEFGKFSKKYKKEISGLFKNTV